MTFDQKKLLIPFWIMVGLFIGFSLYVNESPSYTYLLSAWGIGAAALAPSYLWCAGKAHGIPVYPVFAATFCWTYGFPLLVKHPGIIKYPEADVIWASLYVMLFLGLMTPIWYQFVKKPLPEPKAYYRLPPGNGDNIFLAMVGLGAFFAMGSIGGWFREGGLLPMNVGWFAVLRAFTAGMSILGLFVLSYRAGSKELSSSKSVLLVMFALLAILASGATLILLGAVMVFLLVLIGYTIGSKKLPWKIALIGFFFFNTLHLGKADMREAYRWNEGDFVVQPAQYATLYGDWFRHAMEVRTYKSDPYSGQEETHSLLQRVSLMHMLLIVQERSPEYVPYLKGKTYTIIPELMIPRVLHPNKPRSHEGTYILSIHYGLQSYLSTLHTTIGWGLLNESYANFGPLGIVLLALVLGIFYGKVTQYSINCHLLSARVLFAILVLRFSIQTEFTAGVFVTALLQPTVALAVFTFFFMTKNPQPQRPPKEETRPYMPADDMLAPVPAKGSASA